MAPNNRSLNLSNAAAVVIYEAWRQLNFCCHPRSNLYNFDDKTYTLIALKPGYAKALEIFSQSRSETPEALAIAYHSV